MAWHRRVLQQLQYTAKTSGRIKEAKQWLLKTPYYLGLLPDIQREYPDAIVIQTHRAPAEVIASSASVHARTYGIVSDAIEPAGIADYQIDLYTQMLKTNLRDREAFAASANAGSPGLTIIDLHAFLVPSCTLALALALVCVLRARRLAMGYVVDCMV